jgi:hypothetical protein
MATIIVWNIPRYAQLYSNMSTCKQRKCNKNPTWTESLGQPFRGPNKKAINTDMIWKFFVIDLEVRLQQTWIYCCETNQSSDTSMQNVGKHSTTRPMHKFVDRNELYILSYTLSLLLNINISGFTLEQNIDDILDR